MNRWLHSPVFDGVLIVGPAVMSVVLVLLVPALRAERLPRWSWLVFVVGVDVAHVWSSLYRTYLDPDELRRRRTHYVATPLICFGAGVVLYNLKEGAWDLLVWREHASLFGDFSLPELPRELLVLVVPPLILPQATHYVLDAWIWKFDGSNPGLREYLFGGGEFDAMLGGVGAASEQVHT